MIIKKENENDPEGIRTLNLLIRSQTPYPLGHEAEVMVVVETDDFILTR